MPSAYSIRNRDSSSLVMLNWRLEATNDLTNWITLDVRNHSESNEAAMDLLCRKGATSTWGIDPNICRRLGIADGFNTYRVVQTEANSDGSHFMSIAGFEIYGTPTNPESWQIVQHL